MLKLKRHNFLVPCTVRLFGLSDGLLNGLHGEIVGVQNQRFDRRRKGLRVWGSLN